MEFERKYLFDGREIELIVQDRPVLNIDKHPIGADIVLYGVGHKFPDWLQPKESEIE